MERTPGLLGEDSAFLSLIVSNVIWRGTRVGSTEHISLAELQKREMVWQEGPPSPFSSFQTPYTVRSACVLSWFAPQRFSLASRGDPEMETGGFKFGGSSCGREQTALQLPGIPPNILGLPALSFPVDRQAALSWPQAQVCSWLTSTLYMASASERNLLSDLATP